MKVNIVSYGKKGTTVEVIVTFEGKSYTRHLRKEGDKWTGWNLSHTEIIRYYAVK